MERIGVIRENGVVVNVILWADHTAAQLVADGITDFGEVTDLPIRPGIGWLYDEEHGYRIPSPYPSWVWQNDQWEPPVPMPTDEGRYEWNEETQGWDLIPEPDPEPTEG